LREWLRIALAPIRGDLAEAVLFGSILETDRRPNDVDLALVAVDGAGQPAWRRVRDLRSAVAPGFLEIFALPLSVMVLTPAEWRELDGMIVRGREALFQD
jgi:predicted nucleotidyltransferase